jgi:hypothetical protein
LAERAIGVPKMVSASSTSRVGGSSVRLAGAELVVGLGGGSLLDQAKLATLAVAGPEVCARLTVPQRSGLIVLAPKKPYLNRSWNVRFEQASHLGDLPVVRA